MRLFVNVDLQVLTELPGTSQPVPNLIVPRDANIPLVIQFVQGARVIDPEPSDVTVQNEAQRYHLAELGGLITSSAADDPCVITQPGHPFETGDSVTISGHTGSVPSINGTHVVTKLTANTYSIPVAVTTGGSGGTAVKPAGVSVGQYVRQTDNNRRYRAVDAANLGNASGWQIQEPLSLKWIVKEDKKWDGPMLVYQNTFARIGNGETVEYWAVVNYVTDAINSALGIDPPNVSNDKEQIDAMAELSWFGPITGKSNWIRHSIRNDLTRDGDVTPVGVGVKYGKSAIPNGTDSVNVVFSPPYPNANWHFVGAPFVTNVVDTNPLGLFVVGVASKTANGYTAILSADTNSPNYKLEWVAALD